MFFTEQLNDNRNVYQKYLKMIGGLSNLFSESEVPYLYYRIAEKIFCRAFDAEDLSRSDVAIDAKKGFTGIGVKTFLAGNNNGYQKIAEFNTERVSYQDLSLEEMVMRVSKLRNLRINFVKNNHNVNHLIYHCITRSVGKFKIHEESMDLINTDNIRNIKKNKGSVTFNDSINEYSFLLSKSTLTKRFNTLSPIFEMNVDILFDPLLALERIDFMDTIVNNSENNIKQTIYLPLYSNGFKVAEKSGLNQWNAGGRSRDLNEVYIPIPSKIHTYFPDFFPDRDTRFTLKLPNGEEMQAKVCQDGNKALMSYSNRELGKWILRDVLELEEGDLLKYEKLQSLGIDSVRVDKINESLFEINFAKLGSFEQFKMKYLQ